MRIAIIGSGVSGLVAAHHLHREHQLTIFEANDYIGGHVNTIDVEDPLAGNVSVDTGFIVYNDWTYPHFIELLRQLQIKTRPTNMGFSVRDDRAQLEYNGESLNKLFAQRRNLLRPRFYRLISEILRFHRETAAELQQVDHTVTIGEFLRTRGYSADFAERFLLPMGAAIWSCPTGTFNDFPMRFIIEFYRNHGLLSVVHRPTWRTIEGGSRTYVDALTREFRSRIRLQTPVRAVTRDADGISVMTAAGRHERFDQVIFACHSDQALRILGQEATPTERELLGSFPYTRSVALLHTDISVLPRRRLAWASWNYRVTNDPDAAPTVTYNMNILQGLRTKETYCVTLNEQDRIDPRKVLGEYVYHHPVFTTRRAAAQAQHSAVLGPNRTYFCGAYWRNGFHEDGVVSALAVVNAVQRSAAEQRGRLLTGATP